MEAAVLACLQGAEPVEAIASRRGIPTEELSRWMAAYREAGRAALANMK
jgi:transposase-like protein